MSISLFKKEKTKLKLKKKKNSLNVWKQNTFQCYDDLQQW